MAEAQAPPEPGANFQAVQQSCEAVERFNALNSEGLEADQRAIAQLIQNEVKAAAANAAESISQQYEQTRGEVAEIFNKRQLFIMFESSLGCNPRTDHLSPKNVYPIYQDSVEFQLRSFKIVSQARLSEELAIAEERLTAAVQQFMRRVLSLNEVLLYNLMCQQMQDAALRNNFRCSFALLSSESEQLKKQIRTLKDQVLSGQQFRRVFQPDFISERQEEQQAGAQLDLDPARPMHKALALEARVQELEQECRSARRLEAQILALQRESEQHEARAQALQAELSETRAALQEDRDRLQQLALADGESQQRIARYEERIRLYGDDPLLVQAGEAPLPSGEALAARFALPREQRESEQQTELLAQELGDPRRERAPQQPECRPAAQYDKCFQVNMAERSTLDESIITSYEQQLESGRRQADALNEQIAQLVDQLRAGSAVQSVNRAITQQIMALRVREIGLQTDCETAEVACNSRVLDRALQISDAIAGSMLQGQLAGERGGPGGPAAEKPRAREEERKAQTPQHDAGPQPTRQPQRDRESASAIGRRLQQLGTQRAARRKNAPGGGGVGEVPSMAAPSPNPGGPHAALADECTEEHTEECTEERVCTQECDENDERSSEGAEQEHTALGGLRNSVITSSLKADIFSQLSSQPASKKQKSKHEPAARNSQQNGHQSNQENIDTRHQYVKTLLSEIASLKQMVPKEGYLIVYRNILSGNYYDSSYKPIQANECGSTAEKQCQADPRPNAESRFSDSSALDSSAASVQVGGSKLSDYYESIDSQLIEEAKKFLSYDEDTRSRILKLVDAHAFESRLKDAKIESNIEDGNISIIEQSLVGSAGSQAGAPRAQPAAPIAPVLYKSKPETLNTSSKENELERIMNEIAENEEKKTINGEKYSFNDAQLLKQQLALAMLRTEQLQPDQLLASAKFNLSFKSEPQPAGARRGESSIAHKPLRLSKEEPPEAIEYDRIMQSFSRRFPVAGKMQYFTMSQQLQQIYEEALQQEKQRVQLISSLRRFQEEQLLSQGQRQAAAKLQGGDDLIPITTKSYEVQNKHENYMLKPNPLPTNSKIPQSALQSEPPSKDVVVYELLQVKAAENNNELARSTKLPNMHNSFDIK